MTKEGKFWIALWKIVATALCIIVLASISQCTYKQRLIATAADPILASCGVEIAGYRLDGGEAIICQNRAGSHPPSDITMRTAP